MATLLASRTAFSQEDVDTLRRVADEMAFDVLLSPGQDARDGSHSLDATLEELVTATDFEAFIEDFPIDISPPTDDRPFFFAMIRLGDLWPSDEPPREGLEPDVDVLITLGALLAVRIDFCVLDTARV